MKALLVIFIIYISYVTCNEKYPVKTYPKKVKPYGSGQILIKSGKYVVKPKGSDSKLDKKYTAFQVVGSQKAVGGVPDSPYFPVEQAFDAKPRVKKVLPDYVFSPIHRPKRSPHETPKNNESALKQGDGKSGTKSLTESSPAKKDNSTPAKSGDTQSRAQEKDIKVSDKKDVRAPRKGAAKHGKKGGLKSKNKRAKGHKKRASAKSRAKKSKGSAVVRSKGKGNKGKPKARKGKSVKKPGKKSKSKGKKHDNKHTKKPKVARSQKGDKGKAAKNKGKSSSNKNVKETRRLIGAREAMIDEYPYTVSIQKDGDHWCTGALLNPRLVITTANCLWKAERMSRMQVRAGSTQTDRGGQVADIQEVMKHPAWGIRKKPDYDVALVLLDRNLRFTHSVHGVDLPNRAMLPPFDDAWVTSWGSERRDGVFDDRENHLQAYHTYLLSLASCNNITKRFGVAVSDNFICLSQSARTAPCTRDTGAPAVSDGVLWGIASWGIRKLCGTERFPAMFSYIASQDNMDFITNATARLMSDERFHPFMDGRPPHIYRKVPTTTAETLPPGY
ncbi:uncharacterized protein LOC142982896 [Anticarsia gemmatalis]|uniref:uncharacterized protein LOC142982896 n=1 Tax=Anticarsia gemmatalis TaxID=129554 RepID=UPI003F76243F